MNRIDESILRNDERAIFALRKLYTDNGYLKFKMSKFEEYDLYSHNKDFLVSEGVITFNDTNGKLLALKPDVTLSIIKNSKVEEGYVEKFYYSENVYRISENSHDYKEIMQTGLECIGDIDSSHTKEVVGLALASLSLISDEYSMGISHVGFVDTLLTEYGLCGEDKDIAIRAISDKNGGLLKSVCKNSDYEALSCLVKNYSSVKEAVDAAKKASKSDKSLNSLSELSELISALDASGFASRIGIDFSIVSPVGYYSGIIFKGYINGIGSRVLSGGRYDGLMKRMGRNSKAIGFAVYLDMLERIDESNISSETDDFVNIALPKGRLGEKVYDMFESSGFECPSIKVPNRKLIFENSDKKIRFFWVKPSDVAIYVERGAADIGIAGKDIILEYEPDVYELLDLNIGKCRMAVASKKDFEDDTSKTLRVATKFSNIAKKYYAGKCRDIDIIHLNGSIELAPILGLSDVIVDIVETGKTLIENDLIPRETIEQISARLIVNKSSYSFKKELIEKIKESLACEVNKND